MRALTNGDARAYATVGLSFALGAALTFLLARAFTQWRDTTPEPVSDDVVRMRVMSRVNSIATHPEEIDVTVEEGEVRLAGRVPATEREALLTGLVHLPGVVRVRNALGTLAP